MPVRTVRRLVAGQQAMLATCLLVVLASAGALAQPVSAARHDRGSDATGGPSARYCDGRPVPGAVLGQGRCVLVAAAGFDARERVRVRSMRLPSNSAVILADGRGVVRYRLLVAARAAIGPDVLTFTGLGRPAPGAPGVVSVSVPRHAVFDYRISRR